MKFRSRYIIAILGSFGMGIIYGLKVNFHVAVVSMVNFTAVSIEEGSNSSEHGGGSGEDGPFIWRGAIQGTLLSAYFWGYLVAQIPGGRVAEMVSAKWVMFFAVALNVACTIVVPLLVEIHVALLYVMRILQGIGGGCTFPAMHVMLAHWAPPTERSFMSSVVYTGTSLGTVIFTLITGIISASLGWEWIFYLEGGVSAIWLIFWALLAFDTPEKMILISQEERDFLAAEIKGDESHGQLKMPWLSVFKSVPFWAVLITHTCCNWGFYMTLIELPMYMKQVLNFKISENAALSAVPFLCMWLFSMVLSKTLDTLQAKEIITITIVRKIATLFASVGPCICFAFLCFIVERVPAVILMTIAVATGGGMFSGYLANHLDLSPNFAGSLIALTNTAATLPGIIVPIFVGEVTANDQSIDAWRIIFYSTMAFYVVGGTTFTLLASGEEQEWNKGGGENAG